MARYVDADRQETVESMLEASKRDKEKVPLRRSFVQKGEQHNPEPGVLAAMVRSHDVRALDLYLLHRAMASKEPWDVRPMPSGAWARALGVHTDKDGGTAAVSKTWGRLINKYHLIESSRVGRRSAYTSLHEDGSGAPYTSPDGDGPDEVYLTLPFTYWTAPERWYVTLTLPAKAMLLIGLSLGPGFLLPIDEARDWYGVSRDTASRGFAELEGHGLLERSTKMKRTPLEATINTTETRFTLKGAFTRSTGSAAQHV